jgi:hypothetical protein
MISTQNRLNPAPEILYNRVKYLFSDLHKTCYFEFYLTTIVFFLLQILFYISTNNYDNALKFSHIYILILVYRI